MPRRHLPERGGTRSHRARRSNPQLHRVGSRRPDAGLNSRTRWFYLIPFAGLVITLAGGFSGLVLLGDSWFQLLIAATLGILFTQLALSVTRPPTARSSPPAGRTTTWGVCSRPSSSASAMPGG